MQDFFYSRTDQNKLIQNIVFEFVEDNLENLLERTIKAKRTIDELTIKVAWLLASEVSLPDPQRPPERARQGHRPPRSQA